MLTQVVKITVTLVGIVRTQVQRIAVHALGTAMTVDTGMVEMVEIKIEIEIKAQVEQTAEGIPGISPRILLAEI